MHSPDRRRFLKVLGGATAGMAVGLPVLKALADPSPSTSDEFFILIHQAGGWDVTLWSDPRNETTSIMDPATSANVQTTGITQWQDAPFDGDTTTFRLVQPAGSNLVFGPAIGDLAAKFDRISLVNGISMNTVSHPDGTYYSSTGRHLAGGRPVAASIDTMLASELGPDQLMPDVSVLFPSAFVGNLDRRALPLSVGSITTVAKSLSRSTSYETADERDAVTLMLTDEANDWAKRSYDPDAANGFALQLGALRKLVTKGTDGASLASLFDQNSLKKAQPSFNYAGKYQGGPAVNAAFAVEAMKANVVRCVSFATTSCDTHNSNYQFHPLILQETFDLLAALVDVLDATPHPTKPGDKLSEHTHILVISEFCRTPQINPSLGRDHYPNNSALVISPKWRPNHVFGSSDPDQLLPQNAGTFADGTRPVTPADVLATFLGGLGIDPRKYMRDGDVVKDVLV